MDARRQNNGAAVANLLRHDYIHGNDPELTQSDGNTCEKVSLPTLGGGVQPCAVDCAQGQAGDGTAPENGVSLTRAERRRLANTVLSRTALRSSSEARRFWIQCSKYDPLKKGRVKHADLARVFGDLDIHLSDKELVAIVGVYTPRRAPGCVDYAHLIRCIVDKRMPSPAAGQPGASWMTAPSGPNAPLKSPRFIQHKRECANIPRRKALLIFSGLLFRHQLPVLSVIHHTCSFFYAQIRAR